MNSLQCCTTTQGLPWPSTTSVSFSKWSGSCVGYWNTPRAISGWGEPTCLRCKRRGVGVKVADVIKWEANWDVHLWYLSVMWGFLRGFVSFGYANTTVSTHRLERKKIKKNHRCSHAAYQMWQTSMESDEKTRGRRDWIALFDLYGFLVNSLTALSARFRSKNRLQFL